MGPMGNFRLVGSCEGTKSWNCRISRVLVRNEEESDLCKGFQEEPRHVYGALKP